MLATDMHTTTVHPTDALREADRLMVVCNSCRYCEGLCAVFPAMERRRLFKDGDLNYLANLCHSCGACFSDCQFSPPHEFAVNVPRTLAQVRGDSYRAYAWPGILSGLFARNGLAISLITALSVAAFIAGFVAYHDPAVLFGSHEGTGAFYKLMPHNTMVLLFGAVFLFSILALTLSILQLQPAGATIVSGGAHLRFGAPHADGAAKQIVVPGSQLAAIAAEFRGASPHQADEQVAVAKLAAALN